MTTPHPQPAGCDLDSLRDLIANDGFAMSFQSMGQYRAALIAAARAAQAPQVGQDAITDAQISAGADVLCDCPKPKRIGRNAAIDVFHAMTAAGAQIEQQAAQAPQGDTRQGALEAPAMRSLAVGLPSPDDYDRVLVYTEGVDFNGDQYFDISTEDLWEPDPDMRTEVADAATHWMPLPRPGLTTQAAHTCTPADERASTDLSHRLRETADQQPGWKALLTAAADEIERYYGGMMAWKKTAEKKDRDWNAERMARVDERCAARAAQGAGTAPVDVEPMAWIRRTDITELTDSEPETGGWVALYPAPVSTAPSKSPEFEGIGDAPVSTAAATTASASEPDLLSALKKAARLLKAAGFAMTGTATSQIVAAIDAADSCAVPPPGWQCTRPAGHEGPCAAIQATSNDSSRAADGQQGASRAALDDAVRALEGYADSYDMMTRIGHETVDTRSVAHDIRRNMVNAVRTALARAPLPAQADGQGGAA